LLIPGLGALAAEEPFPIVPVPSGKTVAIDGRLDDWDKSGEYGPVFLDEEIAKNYHAYFFGMYDATHLYLAGDVTDPDPMLNSGDLVSEVFWNGDSATFRFCLNSARGLPPENGSPEIVHLSFWHNHEKDQALVMLKRTMKYTSADTPGVEAKFLKDADKGGYTFEAKVPWETLWKGFKPKSGERIGWTMDVIFSDSTGQRPVFKAVALGGSGNFQGTNAWSTAGAVFFPKGSLVRQLPPPPWERTTETAKAAGFPIEYTLPGDASVSIAIYNLQGTMIRTLLCGQHRKAGNNIDRWDGLDDEGEPVADGAYTWKVATSGHVGVEYVMGVGNNGRPVYRTADGRGSWGGVWGSLVDIATDGKDLYLLWGMEEGEGALVKTDPKGNVIWKQHLPMPIFGTQLALAADGPYVFVAVDAGKYGQRGGEKRTALWRVDVATGNYSAFQKKDPYPYVGKPYPVGQLEDFFLDAIRADGMRTPPQFLEMNTCGLAAAGGRIFVPFFRENAVAVLDGESGAEQKTIENISHPRGVTVGADGSLFVISEKSILKISPDGEKRVVVVKDNLVAPFGIDVDSEGNLWVTDLGESQQVKKFSPQGRLLLTSGKKGGRPFAGKMSPPDFLMPAGVCAAPWGTVYVGEDSIPKRVTLLDSKGRYRDQWIGPEYYSGTTCVDDSDPRYVYAMGGGNPIYRFKVDYAKKTWEVDAYNWKGSWWGTPSEKNNIMYSQWHPRVRQYGRSKYLFSGSASLPMFRIDGFSIVPYACLNLGRQPLDWKEGWTKGEGEYERMKTKTATEWTLWLDANADGRYAENELVTGPFPEGKNIAHYWGGYLDEKMTAWIPTWNPRSVYRMSPSGTDANGAPVYNPKAASVVATNFEGDTSVYADGTGNLYVSELVNGNDRGLDWASRTVKAKVMKFAPTGKLLWKTGAKARSFAKPGEFYRPVQVAGKVDEFVCFVDVNGQDAIYTDDGLYVARLFDDPYRGPTPGPDTIWVEHFGAQVFKEPGTGKPMIMAASDAIHFWHITGLETVRKLEGKVTAKNAKKLTEPGADTAESKVFSITPAVPVPAIDGKLDEWKSARPVTIALDPEDAEFRATVYGQHDDRFLYLAYDVADASPLKNSAKELTTAFKYGDVVDLYLATDPQADPKRSQPAPGDTRVMMGIVDGKPFAFAYRPNVPGTRDPAATFTSPAGQTRMDWMGNATGAQVAASPKPDGKGYVLEARIPWSLFGDLRPASGLRTRGDLAVTFSDEAGTRNASKISWASGKGGIVNDIPTEARLEPAEWGWVEFR